MARDYLEQSCEQLALIEHINKTSPGGRKLRSNPVVVIPAPAKLRKIATPASTTENYTPTERTAMADNPSASNPAAPPTIVQHFTTAQAARHHLDGNVSRWTPPSSLADSTSRPTTPSGEYAYVRAAVHSISVGLQDASLAYTSATNDADETRRRVQARAWLLFDALKRLHDGGCMLRPTMDFSNDFGGELGDRRLRFRERWVAVCKMLQRSSSAAGMVASGLREEILEAYVAAPLAMGRKLEQERRLEDLERLEQEERLKDAEAEHEALENHEAWMKELMGAEYEKRGPRKLKLLPAVTQTSKPTASDQQEESPRKKRKVNLERLPSE